MVPGATGALWHTRKKHAHAVSINRPQHNPPAWNSSQSHCHRGLHVVVSIRSTIQDSPRRLRHIGSLLAALAIAAFLLVTLHNWHLFVTVWIPAGPLHDVAILPGSLFGSQIILLALAVAILIWTVHTTVRRVSRAAIPYMGLARAQTLGTFGILLCYLLLLPVVAWAWGIELSGLVLPGAVTGVVIGIAAQASLGNLINGLVILFTRPYVEGMAITARSPGLVGGDYSGIVTRIGLFHTIMRIDERDVRLPNSAMVQSTVIVRSQELEIYVPVVFPPSVDYASTMSQMRRAVLDALPARRTVTFVLERIDAAGYAVGVHASVANAAEQQTLSVMIAQVMAKVTPPVVVAAEEKDESK